MIIELQGNQESREKEWCVVEFQGEITGDVAGNELGSMRVASDGSVEMIIGQNTLDGNLVALKSPLLVFEKQKGGTTDSEGKSLELQGIVYKKVVFRSRPKPITLPGLIGNGQSR